MKLPTKQLKETKSKAPAKKTATPKATVTQVTPAEKPAQPQQPKDKYVLTAHINNQVFTIEGKGMEVFSNIEKPAKYVTKGIFTLENRETGKKFDIVYQPLLSRKLLNNPIVQLVQWKRMSAKVD